MFEGVGMIDLRNTKIRILSPHHSEEFQRFAFENGCKWPIRRISHFLLCSGFLYINKRLVLSYGLNTTEFKMHPNREITFNSKTHEIEFINNSIKNIDLESLSQQIGCDIREAETSDGSTASYYELPDGATELQHLISYKNMNAQIGEIFRSCYRYGQASHSNKLRDAKKIQFYINAEIERLERLNAK